MHTIPITEKLRRLNCDMCPRGARVRVPQGAYQPFVILCDDHANVTVEEYVNGYATKYGYPDKCRAELLDDLQRWERGEGYY